MLNNSNYICMGVCSLIPLTSFGVIVFIVKYNTNKECKMISYKILIETKPVYITHKQELKITIP